MDRRTRIVATLGPASLDPAVLRRLVRAGVDVFRVNCSHASAAGIRAAIAAVREAGAAEGRDPAVLLDLQGPKIRTGAVREPLRLADGDTLELVMDPAFVGAGRRVGTTWPDLARDARPGEPILFADGLIEGVIETVRPEAVAVRIRHGGELGAHKGINLPGTEIRAPALTDKDRADLRVGVEAGADWVALSFVRSAGDIARLRDALVELGRPELPVIAKIEKPQGVAAIAAILAGVEGIMVARGDLGVEIPFERVPVVQKQLIDAANRAGRLVVTATQMLDSMERNPRPTRAEASDVAHAILDGTDAVMLSGETATGAWPVEAVRTMDRIAREAEASPWFRRPSLDDLPPRASGGNTVLRAACWAVQQRERPLVVFTWSGATAIQACKSRPPGPIVAVTHDRAVARMLALAWGVRSVVIPAVGRTDELIAAGERAILDAGLLPPGEEVVVLAGRAPMRGATNMMKVERLDGVSG